jgi:asparagine synthase (glutamine-hydrolysing)
MCGIAGMVGISDESLLAEMLLRTRHRGPDDSGMYLGSRDRSKHRIALGNNRLSVLDLSHAGHQPMSNEDGAIWVVYNGEIYNFPQLREELVSHGHQLRSETDSEILPHLYEQYGTGMAKHLNGMFAFALWDEAAQKLFLFRDRMGIKPLYYAQAGRKLYFASEIKALLACPEVRAEINLRSLDQYCAFLYVPGPETMFRNIWKLPPGHMLSWHAGEIEVKAYWKLQYGPYLQASDGELIREFRNLLKRAVGRQLASDVPVGLFLSGGVDSSTLLALASEFNPRTRCYCIAYPGEAGALEQSTEDVQYARLVASKFGSHLAEFHVEPDVAGLLPKMVWHLDEPVADPAAISTYLICRDAKSEVTVLLSGQGADEMLAGYRVHFAPLMTKAISRIPGVLRRMLVKRMLPWLQEHSAIVPAIPPGLVLAACRHMQRVVGTAGLPAADQYTSLRSYVSASRLEDLLTADVKQELDRDYSFRFREWFQECAGEDFVNQMLYVDSHSFLPDLNLTYSDKLSMACSIEARVPFLDDEVVEFLAKVPPRLKIRFSTQKYLLRAAMKDILPAGVLSRRKAGFGLPVRSWIRKELREMVEDLLSYKQVKMRGIFNPGVVENMIQENASGREDHTLQIWSLLTLELWQQTFLDHSQALELPAIPISASGVA